MIVISAGYLVVKVHIISKLFKLTLSIMVCEYTVIVNKKNE